MALSGSVSTSSYDGRHLKVSWTATQDIATNKSTISWTLSAAGGDDSYYYDGPITVKIAGSTVYSKEGRTKRYKGTITSGTKTLSHGTDGTKSFSISISAAIYTYAVNCSGSKTFTLDKIPRAATISSADNFTDEGNPVLKYSNPAGSSATTLQACIASSDGNTIYAAYRDINKSGTSYTFSLTTAERETLRKACTTSKTMAVKFYVKTVIGGETYYKSLEKTLTITNAEPTAGITARATDDLTISLWGTDSALILGVSDLTYSVSYSLKKHATLKSIKITNGNASRTTATGTFTGITSNNTVAVITDSRGNSVETNIMFGSYSKWIYPTASLSYSSATVNGNVNIEIKGQCYGGKFGTTSNAIVVQYKIREVGGQYGDYIPITANVSNNSYTATATITGLDYRKSYEITGRFQDSITAIFSNTITVNFLPLFDWGENDFNFNVPVFSSAPIQIHAMSVGNSTEIALTNAMAKIPLSYNYGNNSGSLLTMSNGGIKCNAAGTIMVFGALHCNSLTAGDTVEAAVYVGSSASAASYGQSGSKTFLTTQITPKVINVDAGEVIYLYGRNYTAARGASPANNSTLLTVIYIGGEK